MVFWATFSGDADFEAATFSGGAEFRRATFSGEAGFEAVTFSGEAGFEAATFSGGADFGAATFANESAFSKATFSGDADFSRSTVENGRRLQLISSRFGGRVFFTGADIQGQVLLQNSHIADALIVAGPANGWSEWEAASFRHTRVGRLILERVRLVQVPDFVGFHVDGAVDLEHTEAGEELPDDLQTKDPFDRARELAARWRALKRLAEQARHHYYTALFARNEMRAREPLDFRQRPLAWLLGRIYGLLSDYGLSLWRPWAWWIAALSVFAMIYARTAHPELRFVELVACIPGFGVRPPLDDAANEICSTALVASFSAQAPIAPRLWQAAEAGHPFAALFGAEVPAWVPVLGTVQTVISTILLFFFLLAVRNHFRIR